GRSAGSRSRRRSKQARASASPERAGDLDGRRRAFVCLLGGRRPPEGAERRTGPLLRVRARARARQGWEPATTRPLHAWRSILSFRDTRRATSAGEYPPQERTIVGGRSRRRIWISAKRSLRRARRRERRREEPGDG